MPLSAAPTYTSGTTGNLVTSGSLAASTASSAVFYVGVAAQSGAQGSTTTGAALFARLQIKCTYGTIAATSGLHVQVLSTSDGGTTYDTIGLGGADFVQTAVGSTTVTQSFDLPPGQYMLKMTNTDATNAVTTQATLGTAA